MNGCAHLVTCSCLSVRARYLGLFKDNAKDRAFTGPSSRAHDVKEAVEAFVSKFAASSAEEASHAA